MARYDIVFGPSHSELILTHEDPYSHTLLFIVNSESNYPHEVDVKIGSLICCREKLWYFEGSVAAQSIAVSGHYFTSIESVFTNNIGWINTNTTLP